MSDSRNWNGTGEQIKSALSEALQSGDFKNLNDLVSQTVADAIRAPSLRMPMPGSRSRPMPLPIFPCGSSGPWKGSASGRTG